MTQHRLSSSFGRHLALPAPGGSTPGGGQFRAVPGRLSYAPCWFSMVGGLRAPIIDPCRFVAIVACYKEPPKDPTGILKQDDPKLFLAGSLWHKISGATNIMSLLTNESQASLDLDQWEWRTLACLVITDSGLATGDSCKYLLILIISIRPLAISYLVRASPTLSTVN